MGGEISKLTPSNFSFDRETYNDMVSQLRQTIKWYSDESNIVYENKVYDEMKKIEEKALSAYPNSAFSVHYFPWQNFRLSDFQDRTVQQLSLRDLSFIRLDNGKAFGIKFENDQIKVYSKKGNFFENFSTKIIEYDIFKNAYSAINILNKQIIFIIIVYRNYIQMIMLKNLGGFGEIPVSYNKIYEIDSDIFNLKIKGDIVFVTDMDKNLYEINIRKSLETYEFNIVKILPKQIFNDDVIFEKEDGKLIKITFDFDEYKFEFI